MHASPVFFISLAIIMMVTQSVMAATFGRSQQAISNADGGVDDDLLEVLRRFELGMLLQQAAPIESVKRNIDLGFSRGFSGSQAAKHLMGLAAANFAGGPGRRKRHSVQVEELKPENWHEVLQN